MPAWDNYPETYREAEVRRILPAARAGECSLVIGLSGAGKSNLLGFIAHRCAGSGLACVLVDGNRAQPRTAAGLFRVTAGALGLQPESPADLPALERATAALLEKAAGVLCLLFDRYDALSPEERAAASGPLRALRDTFKYQLAYVVSARRPLDATDELAELFYANTLWLGPLSPADARWSAAQYARRRDLAWDGTTLDGLAGLSGGYPALLRACCEAHAGGAALTVEAMRENPAVQRRAQEFWADSPAPDDMRRSGIKDHPLLTAAQPAISAESPDLTASEHRLLAYLQAHGEEVCAKDDLIRAVWPEERLIDGLRDDSLAQLIRRLRQKIGAERIQTIPGRGYRYVLA